jgi:hypothetical protein
MKLEMRKKLAREPFAEKIRKVGQLVRLAKSVPRRNNTIFKLCQHPGPKHDTQSLQSSTPRQYK